ncbi:hypothetical protein [Hyalangium rubrum]|uniref:Lipoprotein n=1 Tax=Hyalangium rubrum TaxID=3103134 RepID=A0ABU5H9T8_9BACT|nr:hypothetical protein [Hyalangium sp. s54d21]MDY7228880.1 hypothetical protein [Hyalangium sp. s54d21]
MRTTEDWSRLGGVLIAALAVATALAVLGPRLLGRAAGPEVEIISALKATEREGLSLSLPGIPTPLTAREHRFARITVRVEPGGERAEALATLDFTGTLGAIEVSSLGVERVPFVLKDGDWVPEGLEAPRLAAAVLALERRRRALEAGDREALALLAAPAREDGGGAVEVGGPELEQLLALKERRYGVSGWRLRLERDEAVVTELWRLEGTLPSRPVDQRGERRLILIRSGEEFLFSPALM